MKRKIKDHEFKKHYTMAHFDAGAKKEFDPNSTLTISGFANTGGEDRIGDIILPSAWNMDNFKKNPIILFNHDYDSPVGRGVDVKIKDGGLFLEAEIGNPSSGYPLTKTQLETRSLLAQGILKAFSVGFWPKDGDYDEEKGVFIFTDVELLEVSIVSVPCQQDSLVEQVKGLNNCKRSKVMDEETKKMLTEISDGVKACVSKIGEVYSKLEGSEKPSETPSPVEESLKAEIKTLKDSVASHTESKAKIEQENAQLKTILDGFLALNK